MFQDRPKSWRDRLSSIILFYEVMNLLDNTIHVLIFVTTNSNKKL